MSQSKLVLVPIDLLFYIGTKYSQSLSTRPLITKSITSGALAALGNFIAQLIKNTKTKAQSKQIKKRSIYAYGAYGLFISGPLLHYFFKWLHSQGPRNPILKVIIDRLIFGPFLLLIALYALPTFEGGKHREIIRHIKKIYLPAFLASLKLWVPAMYLNLNYVPIKFQVLIGNLVSVIWNIYLSGVSSGGDGNGASKKKVKNEGTSGSGKENTE